MKKEERLQSTLLYKGKPTKLRAGDIVKYSLEEQTLWFTRRGECLRHGPCVQPGKKMIFSVIAGPITIALLLQQLIGFMTGCETSVIRCDNRIKRGYVVIQLHRRRKGTSRD